MNPQPIKKAMVLAAGMGTRLLPITETMPKPLVPILNIPGVLFTLSYLKELGIQSVVLNTHHLPDVLENFLGNGSRWGLDLSYSRESKILGTGGGLKKAGAFFGKEPFLLLNCDFVTNFDIRPSIQSHIEKKALATMILMENVKRKEAYSAVGVSATGELTELPTFSRGDTRRKGVFSGIHILDPEAIREMPEGFSAITETLYATQMKKSPARVRGEFVSKGYWFDTGDIPALIDSSFGLLDELQKEDSFLSTCLLEHASLREYEPGIWIPKNWTPDHHTTLKAPLVVGKGIQIQGPTVLGPYAVVGEHCRIETDQVSRRVALPNSILKKRTAPGEGAVQFGTLELNRTK